MSTRNRPEFGNVRDMDRFLPPNRELELYEVAERADCPKTIASAYWRVGGEVAMVDYPGPTLKQWAQVKVAEDALRAWGRSVGLRVSNDGMREDWN